MNSLTFNSTNKYKEYNNYEDNNKYLNLGLSVTSQELIIQFYHAFNEGDLYRERFEEVLYSVLEDIQKYKSQNYRLEQAQLAEKEKNDEIMSNMIEEAERQLIIASEKIKENERNECERLIERLNQQHTSEMNSLLENLNKMKSLEQKYLDEKLAEDSKLADLKAEIENLRDEKRIAQATERELLTQVSVLRSEIAQLKAICNEKDIDRKKNQVFGSEAIDLKKEINVLQQTNKMLNDTNDVLLTEIKTLKTKTSKASLERLSVPFENNLHQETNIISTPTDKNKLTLFANQPNYLPIVKVTDDSFTTDEEVDSGNWTFIKVDNEANKKSEIESYKKPSMSIPKSADLSPKQSSLADLSIKQKPKPKGLPERMFKLVFAGDSAVGKTSFIMRYCMGEFHNDTSATLGVDFHIKLVDLGGKTVALQLWDTCGQERYRSIAMSYFRRADGIVLMYDCIYEQSFVNVVQWVESINEISEKKIPIIIVANKTDLRDAARLSGKKVIEYEEGYKLSQVYQSLFIEISTKDGTNIEDSLIELCKKMNCNQDNEIISNSIKLGHNNKSAKKNKCC